MTKEELKGLSDNDLWLRVAEQVMGWHWWAFTKAERDEPNGPRTERVVRSLRRREFPNKHERQEWTFWTLQEPGRVFRPANGTEPIERIQGTLDAMAAGRPCWLQVEDEIERQLLGSEYAEALADVLDTDEPWHLIRAPIRQRLLAAALMCESRHQITARDALEPLLIDEPGQQTPEVA